MGRLVGEENSAQVPVEHKLLVEVMFERGLLFGHWLFRRLTSPIQGVPLRWGFKATNVGKSSFPGATVKEIRISSSPPGSGPQVTSDEDFSIPPLNPREPAEHWFGKSLVLNFDRTAWVDCKLEPPDSSHQIRTFQQVDVPSLQPSNQWGMSVFIEPKLARIQANTNRLILALTALTALEGFIGLKAIGTWFLNGVRNLLRWLLQLIG